MMDNDSKEFIAYAEGLLEDETFYREFLLEGRRKFQNFISRNPEEIKRMLHAKLVKGSIEHGSPGKYTQEQVQNELEMEFLDIIGWSLVGLYCEKKSNERKTTEDTSAK